MSSDYMSFEFGREDGTLQSENDFFAEHKNIRLTSVEREHLKRNLEKQCSLIAREFYNKEIEPYGFYESFIFKDINTNELYLMPLEINIGVFIKKAITIILIYDIREI